MIVNTNKKDKKGRDIYMNVLTGEKGSIGRIYVHPSQRSEKRHPVQSITKVKSNRKSTRGRRIYYQTIAGKTIKHIQETGDAIIRKSLINDVFMRIMGIKK